MSKYTARACMCLVESHSLEFYQKNLAVDEAYDLFYALMNELSLLYDTLGGGGVFHLFF